MPGTNCTGLSFVFTTASFSQLALRSLLAHSRCSREASAAPVVVDGLTSSSRSKHWCNQELLIRRSARLSRRRGRPQQVSKVDERLLLRVRIITADLPAAAASSGAGRGARRQLLQRRVVKTQHGMCNECLATLRSGEVLVASTGWSTGQCRSGSCGVLSEELTACAEGG